MFTTKQTLATLTAASVLGAAGVGVAHAGPTADASASQPGKARKAIKTATRSAGGTAYDIDRDGFRGRPTWEVKTSTGKSVIVSISGTRVVATRNDRLENDDRAQLQAAKVSLSKAITIADRRASGFFTSADIDNEGGAAVWTLSFEKGFRATDVDVNAVTGKVVRVESDTDD